MMRLEHVVFYRGLGFSLEQIKKRLLDKETDENAKMPPWTLLATFVQSLGTVDASIWSSYEFTEEQTEVFQTHFQAIDDAM